jgi:hypothetical protein
MTIISIAVFLAAVFFNSMEVLACIQCRPAVKSGVYNQNFAGTLFMLLLPLAVLFTISIAFYFSDAILTKVHQLKGEKPWRRTYDAGR